jgi:chemotaxis response regulator CheB
MLKACKASRFFVMPEDAAPDSHEGSSGTEGAQGSEAVSNSSPAEQDCTDQLDDVLLSNGTVQPVIALGGSAGSFGALRVFFSNMPADSGLSFVVIVH